ncbi:hypothetical protein [Streptomyces sp. SM11]|uniref:hypothetical protein n=1 Tax=Streptomyces sp. SM11 TaxID=565557 RepID=UPI000CD5036F|nr:hypothetical protein [Streptomyces sp. SM11]
MNLDDLQDLRTLIAEKTGEAVRVSVGRYDADEVVDLTGASDADLASIRLSVSSEALRVHLTPDGATVLCESREQDFLDLVDDIKSFVDDRPLAWRIVYPFAALVGFLALWGMVIWVSLWFGISEGKPFGYVMLVVSFVAFGGLFWYLPRSWKYRGAVQVVPLRRDELRRRRFESRNSVLSGILGAVVGAIMGSGATIAAVYLSK